MLAVAAAELSAIQKEVVAAVCDQICNIWHKSGTTIGATGESTSSYAYASTTVAGLSQPTATELQNYDYLIASKAAWTVRLPVGTVVFHQDHLLIGTAPSSTLYPGSTLYPNDVQTLEVHVLLTPRSYPAFLSVIAAVLK